MSAAWGGVSSRFVVRSCLWWNTRILRSPFAIAATTGAGLTALCFLPQRHAPLFHCEQGKVTRMASHSRKEVPRYFMVNDFDRVQHYSNRRPPWVKLYNSLLDDPAFTSLSFHHRFIYCACLLLASRLENRIPSDIQYLKHALQTNEEIDLTPLIKSGFLIAWSKSKSLAQSKSKPLAQSDEGALAQR
jgi:hypothetical protein